ncbi:putative tat pathway signal sequence [Phaeomoniella chlamydospora]|uniref:Putative tat pathway signal sequence n=1 Tax=Phaeomoniella chlamydospora TaxID=158046 RepID=A0A0G2EZR1_PHACM|nr:putative tat pathway signal sequence [Phaeomoniella chlamydospora]
MIFSKRSQEGPAYGKLESEDCETLMPQSDRTSTEHLPQRLSLRAYVPLGIQIFSVILAALVGVWFGRQQHTVSDYDAILHVSQNSPITEDVSIKFDFIRFNGTFMDENIYRQDAGPEVDAAWEALGVNYRALAVPEHLAQKVGLAPDQVKIKTKYGGGYPANVEGLHHLHCLNLLRQTSYYNYDYYHDLGKGAFSNNDVVVRKHTSHCLDILRQQLMCTVDIGVLGQVWWQDSASAEDGLPPRPNAFTDFNTVHKCRNYDAVRQWAEERQLPIEVPPDFLEMPKEGDRIHEGVP